jgi:hypothetical protein
MKPFLLIVDDDPQVLQAIGIDLRHKYGDRFRVLKADSGAPALDILKQLKLRKEPPALFRCGPDTDNSTCSTTNNNTGTPTSNPQSTPTSGCGPGTDNSTCSSTSIPKPTQPTHKGSSLGSSTSNSNNAIGSQITTNEGNSPTPPPCPDKGPIPPNCTMKPVIK